MAPHLALARRQIEFIKLHFIVADPGKLNLVALGVGRRRRVQAAPWQQQALRGGTQVAPTFGRKVLNPRMSSLCPLNSDRTRAMTPVVSILHGTVKAGIRGAGIHP